VEIGGRTVLGCWEIGSLEADPIEDRFNFLREHLPQIFRKVVSRKDAEDLTQELLLSILSSEELKYSVLESPAKAAQLARSLLLSHNEERARDRALRARIGETHRGVPRHRILEFTAGAYSRLSVEERGVLERFWAAELQGDAAADVFREQAMALVEQVDKSVELEIASSES
jgi:hypothetical protein